MKKYLIMLVLFIFPVGSFAAEGKPVDNVGKSVTEVPAVVITTEEVDVDPVEAFNRGMYRFNETIDDIFLEPVAKGYRVIVPAPAREKVSNVVSNLSEPVTVVNSLLQGDVNNSLTSFWRFIVNSTFGIGGLFDVATEAGLEKRKEDFGQTLGASGVGSGPYLVVPLIGPTNPRDLIGKTVDIFTSPFNYAGSTATIAINTTDTVSTREGLIDTMDEIEETSFDPYATIRSAYIQKREDEINNGNAVNKADGSSAAGVDNSLSSANEGAE